MDAPVFTITPALEMLDFCHYEHSYFYEDLIFTKHNTFLIRIINKDGKKIEVFTNFECEEDSKDIIIAKLFNAAYHKGVEMDVKGTFEMKEKKGEIDLIFHQK